MTAAITSFVVAAVVLMTAAITSFVVAAVVFFLYLYVIPISCSFVPTSGEIQSVASDKISHSRVC